MVVTPITAPVPLTEPWAEAAEQVLERLDTSLADGLPSSEAEDRLRQERNVLPAAHQPSTWQLVLAQLRDTMILVLLAAAVMTTAVGDVQDTAIIGIVVLLNTALGVDQQRRAQRAISALTELTAPTATVLRDGEPTVVPAADVVVGDLLLLQAGDLVAADARVVEADELQVDEATLTGESEPATKSTGACPGESPVADRTCMVHAGSAVTHGRSRAVVTDIGARTQVGQVAQLLQDAAPKTPLERRLAQFGRQLAVAVVALCLVVLALGLLRGEPLERMLLTSISLAVAAVPESLPAVVVLSLALAAQRMARRGAVVRTLPAVEALGSVTVIATDKTGTLTEGRMSARLAWTPLGMVRASGEGFSPDGRLDGEPAALTGVAALLEAVVLCNDAQLVERRAGWLVVGDPMEGALLALAGRGGLDVARTQTDRPRLSTYPFDHDRARMTTVHEAGDQVLVVCKGSPEAVLALLDLTAREQQDAEDRLAELTADGLRVLAVASGVRPSVPEHAQDAEVGLHLVGLVGLQDPVRATAATSVAHCREAGIRPIMITGDHPATAAAIARSAGLLATGEQVVTGADIAGLSDDALQDVRVFARTSPTQKLAIVEGLRRCGHVVAMTGDGVNDAPALRQADVGVAMGRSGTQVARQAADLVLTDDDFATVVAAVEEGRRVYDNVRRFLLYAVTGGFAEVAVMVLGPFLGLALPLLPGQILWVNLLTHGLPGVALGAERAERDILQRTPRDPSQGVLSDGLLRRIVLLGSVVTTASLILAVGADRRDLPWQTMLFVVITLQQLWLALALRSTRRSALRVGLRGNPALLGSVAVNALLLWAAVGWDPLAGLLQTDSLTLGQWSACAAASLAAPLAAELDKLATRHSRNQLDPPVPQEAQP